MVDNKETIYRICDVNLNRVREGLRVVEEYLRFYVNNEQILDDIRKVRHDLADITKDIYNKIIKERDIARDPGLGFDEKDKKNIESVVIASIKRVQEGLRVLEEFSKIVFKDKAPLFKNLRFRLYDIEKKIWQG